MIDNNTKTTPENGWPKTNGMTVPEGYFANFTERMMAQLPEEPMQQPKVVHGWWQKVKPYTYMAAMFAGAWLLLNIFTIGRTVKEGAVTTAGGSDMIAQVVNTNTKSYVDDYISVSDYELYNDLYESGFEIPEKI